jgi:predicted permease
VQQLLRGPGFDPGRVVVLRLRPSLVDYDAAKAWAFQREVIRRLGALPGVESASTSEGLPMFDFGIRVDVSIPPVTPGAGSGGDSPRPADTLQVLSNRVGDGYFATLGARLLDGREFTDRDRVGAPATVILNDVLARRLWPGERGGALRALGRALVVDGREHEVVGVVRDIKYHSLTDRPAPYLFRSYWQQEDSTGWQKDSRTHVRVSGGSDARAIVPALRREIAAIDASVPLSEDYALVDRVKYTYQPVRLARTALVAFAALALALSTIGLYGVLAFTVSHRTREIAIRMALGARRDDVARLVLGQSARLAAAGAALGIAGALAGARSLGALLYGVPRYDVVAFAAAPLVLGAVALVASWVPVRRAARVDQSVALRHE